MSAGKIRIRIERLRRIMHIVARERGISHPDVLRVSRLLDKKLNEYNRRIKHG
ncbi:MAG: aspartyl-phosphate phosphatase Spo0E family protein [Negativicutes bacterium]|nr:aspartyl-phosphate phosphatase Spo0E family protein [Negativicutes bacterium]